MAANYGLSPFNPGVAVTPAEKERERQVTEAQKRGTKLTTRLKGGAKGALTGFLATGSPYGALAGGTAGFIAPKLTGETGGGGAFGASEQGGDMGNDKNSMSDVRARIEDLRRQQYAQRTANLEQVMGFFGPVNQELKSIYGVDMPTWKSSGRGPGQIPEPGPGVVDFNPFTNPDPNAPVGAYSSGGLNSAPPPPPAMAQSPFSKAPVKRYIGTGTLPQNYPGTGDSPEEIAAQGGTGRSPKKRAGDWKSGPRYG